MRTFLILLALTLSGCAVAHADSDDTDDAFRCWQEHPCRGRPAGRCAPGRPVAPCGAPGCAELQNACDSNTPCVEGERCAKVCEEGTCGAPHKCVPKTCKHAADCGSTNLLCSHGACTHRHCRSSSECLGYCVADECWRQPGYCRGRPTAVP